MARIFGRRQLSAGHGKASGTKPAGGAPRGLVLPILGLYFTTENSVAPQRFGPLAQQREVSVIDKSTASLPSGRLSDNSELPKMAQ